MGTDFDTQMTQIFIYTNGGVLLFVIGHCGRIVTDHRYTVIRPKNDKRITIRASLSYNRKRETGI